MSTGIRSQVSSPAATSLQAQAATTTVYDGVQRSGVICLTIPALMSLCAMLYMLVITPLWRAAFSKTRFFPLAASLVLANALQSIGMLVNFHWVTLKGVHSDRICEFQGVVLHLGSLSSAFSTSMIAIHLFRLILFRTVFTKRSTILSLILGWAAISLLVIIGPTVVHRSAIGQYYGVSGAWCSISREYPYERVFLEYFPDLLAAGVNVLLFTIMGLLLRGHLVILAGGLRLRGNSQSQKKGSNHHLADSLESSVLQICRVLLWIPLIDSFLFVPFAVVRHGHRIPVAALTFVTILYNLNGFVNVVILVLLSSRISNAPQLPQFVAPNKRVSLLREERPQSFPNSFIYTSRRIDPMAHQDKYLQYQGPNQDAFFIALPRPAPPAVLKTNVQVEKSRSEYRSPDDYYRSPDETMGNHLC